MEMLWLITAPVFFLLPGWWPAQCVTGRAFAGATFAWAVFFSVILLPPLCFGLAMIAGTVVGYPLLLAVSLACGLGGLLTFFHRRNRNA